MDYGRRYIHSTFAGDVRRPVVDSWGYVGIVIVHTAYLDLFISSTQRAGCLNSQ